MKRFAILLVVLAIAVLAWPTRALSGIPLDQIGEYVSGESQKAPPSVSTPSGGVSLDQIATYVGGGEVSVSTEKRKVRKHQARRKAPKKGYIAKKPTEFKRLNLAPAVPIPSESECVTHKVAKGDTVIGLAKKLGTTPEMIWALNHDLIKNPNLIKIGWNLKVPASKLAPTDSAPVSTSSGAATAPASAPVTVFMGIVIQC